MRTTNLHVVAAAAVLGTGCSLIYGTDGFLGTDASQESDAGSDAGRADSGIDGGCEVECDGECADTQNDPLHCGGCTPCSVPDNGSATCVEGMCAFTCEPGYVPVLERCEPRAPRPIAPLSTSTATSRRPTFRWDLGPHNEGAHIEICADRACTSVVETVVASGSSGQPSADLPSGVVYWRLYGRMGGETGTEPSVTWQLHIRARSAPIDTSWGTTLDVNADGAADVAVGAHRADSSRGRVHVYLGSNLGLSTEPVTLVGPVANQHFGWSLDSVGDVNGDGYGDLIVGANGRAYLYFGGAAGLSSDPMVLEPIESGLSFGDSVAGAGDINGDGYGDIIVGGDAPHVFFGGELGLSPESDPVVSPAGTVSFGVPTAGAGDLNGDGYGDGLIGAWGDDSLAGKAYVYLGGDDGLSSDPIILVGPDGPDGLFGSSLASADANGDGYADVVIGAPGADSQVGRVYVYFGATTGLSGAPPLVLDSSVGPAGGFGSSIGSGMNDNGYDDLIIGAPGAMMGGAVTLYAGETTGLREMFSYPFPDADGLCGVSVAGAGDVNGDGLLDFLVGCPGSDSNAGVVDVMGMEPVRLSGPDGPGGWFGSALAGSHQPWSEPSDPG